MWIGLAYGIVISLFVSLIILFFGGVVIRAPFTLRDYGWFVGASIVPLMVAFSYLGSHFKKQPVTRRRMWIYAWGVAFVVAYLADSIGAITMQNWMLAGTFPEGGPVNWRSYLQSGLMYALVSLPVTVPLSYLLLQMLYRSMQRQK